MLPHIQQALEHMNHLKKQPYRWVSFEATPEKATLTIGVIHDNGFIESPTVRREFILMQNNEVYVLTRGLP